MLTLQRLHEGVPVVFLTRDAHLNLLHQMKHWELSGHKAREAMSNYFQNEEMHSEATHLESYVNAHPFLGDHPRPSMSAAIKRSSFPRMLAVYIYVIKIGAHVLKSDCEVKLFIFVQGCAQVSHRWLLQPAQSWQKGGTEDIQAPDTSRGEKSLIALES